jgi:hypothetical protein
MVGWRLVLLPVFCARRISLVVIVTVLMATVLVQSLGLLNKSVTTTCRWSPIGFLYRVVLPISRIEKQAVNSAVPYSALAGLVFCHIPKEFFLLRQVLFLHQRLR